MAGNARQAGESVASKIFAVLDTFAGERTELSASVIGQITGIPRSTLNRLLRGLVSWGGLERSESGGYRVGIKLWEVAARVEMSSDLRSAALPLLQNLIRATEANVGLGTLDGREGLILEKITLPRGFESVGRIGGRVPLHASAMGKLMLAFSPPQFQEEILRRPLERYTTLTKTDARVLRSELAQVRLQRYATCVEEVSLGEIAVAAPIVDGQSQLIAALSAIVPSDYSRVPQLVTAVRSCAQGISQLWAAYPPPSGPRSVMPRSARPIR